MTPRLSLRKETLAELTSSDLAAVNGASVHFTIDTFLTQFCTPLATAIVQTVQNATHEMTLLECGR